MHAMEDRIARALNCLGEDADILSTDTDGLLDLLDDHLDDDDPSGKTPPSTHYYSTTNTTKSNNVVLLVLTESNNNNTTLVASDESMEGVEDPLGEADELEESNPQSAEEIISVSLLSGSLTDVCDVSVTMRSVDSDEEELVKTFADHGCTCVLGPHKSPCCKLFSADHYLSVRGALTEMTNNELDLMVMGQIRAQCFPSPSAPSHSASSERDAHCHEVFSPRATCVSADLSVSAHHRDQVLQKHQGKLLAQWTSSKSIWQQGEETQDSHTARGQGCSSIHPKLHRYQTLWE